MVTLPKKAWGGESLFLSGSGPGVGTGGEVGVGEGTGVGVAVGVGVGVGVGMGVSVGVGTGVAVGSGDGVGVAVAARTAVGAMVRSTCEKQAVKTNNAAVKARNAPLTLIKLGFCLTSCTCRSEHNWLSVTHD